MDNEVDLVGMNPKDIVTANPEEINAITQSVINIERVTRDTTRELEELNEALISFSGTHEIYRSTAADVRRRMNNIAKDL